MGKLSKLLLNSIFISAARAETFQVTSCNDENDTLRPPALTFRIAQDHFESNVSEQTDLYTFVDGPDGGYQERTIQQDELSLSFDSETDDILLSFTLALQPTSGFQLNNDASIGFGGDSVVFQCRYARAISATSQMTVTTPAPGPVSNTGDLTYSMSVDVGALGGDSRITISPNHNLSGLSPRFTSCRVSSGEHNIYPIHSFQNDVCFDNTRLNVEQTVFGETIEFTMKTFRFTSGGASDSADEQEQTISCDLHLEPSADIVQEQAADCSCYTQDQCPDWVYASCEDGTWTSFMSRDNPTGNADHEATQAFRDEGIDICNGQNAISIEARVRGTGIDYSETGQIVTIDPVFGFECLNADQANQNCNDYEVRFCCP